MSQSITVQIYSSRPGCPPLSCGSGDLIAIELKPASANKSADGAGWLVGTISAVPVALCMVGAGDWVYQITIPDSEFSSEFLADLLGTFTTADINTGDGAVGLCCLNCGIHMILDRLALISERSINRESFRIHNYNESHQNKMTRLFRMALPIKIYGIEASVEEHLTGYPYASEPQDVIISFQNTQGHHTTPFTDSIATRLHIDPGSTAPLANRIDFVPPLEIPAGAGFAVTNETLDIEAHLGLEIHVDFVVQEP